MTPSQLKAHVESNNPNSKFFTRENMKFAGDTMKNYGVCSAVIKTNYDKNGEHVEVWELYRKRSVKGGLNGSAYFRADTFKQVHKASY